MTSLHPFSGDFQVSCDMPTVGASGREQWHNGLCVLSQNVINEKIYLALWFYLVFVMVCCCFFIFYRLATIFFEPFRYEYNRIEASIEPEKYSFSSPSGSMSSTAGSDITMTMTSGPVSGV